MNYPDGVEIGAVAVIINDAGQTLVFKSGKWGGKWILAGGHVEPGEKLYDACVREVKEETGLDIKIIKQVFHGEHFLSDQEYTHNVHAIIFGFLVKIQDDAKIKLDNLELQEYKWVSIDEAQQMLVKPYNQLIDTFKKSGDLK